MGLMPELHAVLDDVDNVIVLQGLVRVPRPSGIGQSRHPACIRG